MYAGGENIKKSIQELICIHMVTDGTCEKYQSKGNSFHEYMCDAHSRGMDKFGHRELQMVLLIDPKLIAYAINSVVEKILDGDIKPKDKLVISNVFDCDIRLDEAVDKDGKPLWRIVVPDEKGKYPEETDDEIFAMQAKSPYKNKVN